MTSERCREAGNGSGWSALLITNIVYWLSSFGCGMHSFKLILMSRFGCLLLYYISQLEMNMLVMLNVNDHTQGTPMILSEAKMNVQLTLANCLNRFADAAASTYPIYLQRQCKVKWTNFSLLLFFFFFSSNFSRHLGDVCVACIHFAVAFLVEAINWQHEVALHWAHLLSLKLFGQYTRWNSAKKHRRRHRAADGKAAMRREEEIPTTDNKNCYCFL